MNTHQNQPYLQNLRTQSVHILSDTVIIGRHQDCNLVLKSERGASRKHARITVQNGNVVIMDLGSLNGTLVNGREINRAVQLADGDIVIFDEQEYRFTGSAADSQIGSNNVTVIANKDEIGRPDRIKPAIRLVETMPASLSKEVNNDTNNETNNEASEASLDETKAWGSMASNLEQSLGDSDIQDTGQRYPSVSPAQAENQKKQRQELTEKLKTQEPQSQDAQAQKSQTPYSTPYTTPESPESQSLPMQKSHEPAPRDIEEPAGQDREPHPGMSQGRGQQSQENWSNAAAYQARDPDAFNWQPDEPHSVKVPAQHEPAYRHQSDQTTPQNAYPSQNQHSAQSTSFHDDQDHFPPFPTTSRPGGDARSRGNDHFMADMSSTRPGLQKHSYKPVRKKNVNWTLWFIVIPVMTLIAIGAVYLAYNAGISAGSSSPSGFS